MRVFSCLLTFFCFMIISINISYADILIDSNNYCDTAGSLINSINTRYYFNVDFNLDCSGVSGPTIAASGVTLDCGGNYIKCGASSSNFALIVSNSGTVINNCDLQKGFNGKYIQIDSGTTVTFDGLSFTANSINTPITSNQQLSDACICSEGNIGSGDTTFGTCTKCVLSISPSSITWGAVSDSTPPTISSQSFSPSSPSSSTSTTLTATVSDDTAVDSCKWSLADQSYALMGNTCTGTTSISCDVTGLTANSANTVYVACSDGTNEHSAANNYEYSYTVDTTAPTTTSTLKNADNSDYTSGTLTNQDVTVTLTPSCGLSGCAWTKYCTGTDCVIDNDNGNVYSSQTYSASTIYRFKSKDNAGNIQGIWVDCALAAQ